MLLVSLFCSTVIKQVKERIWKKVWTRAALGIASTVDVKAVLRNHMVYIFTSLSGSSLLSEKLPQWTCNSMTTSGSWELVDGFKFQLQHFNVKTVNNKIQLQNLNFFAVLPRLDSTVSTSFICWTFFWSQHCLAQRLCDGSNGLAWDCAQSQRHKGGPVIDQFPKRCLLSAQHRGWSKCVSWGHEALGTTISSKGFDIYTNGNPSYKTKDFIHRHPNSSFRNYCPQMDCNLKKHPFNGRVYCWHVRSVPAFQGKAQFLASRPGPRKTKDISEAPVWHRHNSQPFFKY